MSAAPISGMPEGVSLTGAGVLRVCPHTSEISPMPDLVGEIPSFPLASCSDPQSLHRIFSCFHDFFTSLDVLATIFFIFYPGFERLSMALNGLKRPRAAHRTSYRRR